MSDIQNYEIMIPVYWEQLDIISWSIPYILKNLKPKRIVLIGPKNMSGVLKLENGVEYVDGNNLLEGLNKENVANIINKIVEDNKVEIIGDRSGWYFQQFIKMAYANRTKEKEYLVWDADMVPINYAKFYNEKTKKRIFISGGKHHHMVYYDTMSKLLGTSIKPTKEETYVSQYMLINCEIMKELTKKIEKNTELRGNLWWEKILYAVDSNELQEAGFSEFETYGEFVNLYYSEEYEMKSDTRKITNTRKFFGSRPSADQIEWMKKDYDYIGFESWVENSKFWSFLCSNLKKIVPFKIVVEVEGINIKIESRLKHRIKKVLNLRKGLNKNE